MTQIDWSKPLEVCRPFVDVKVLEPYWVSVKNEDDDWISFSTTPEGTFTMGGVVYTNGIRNVCPVSEVQGLRAVLMHSEGVSEGRHHCEPSEEAYQACWRLLDRLESEPCDYCEGKGVVDASKSEGYWPICPKCHGSLKASAGKAGE